MTRRYELDELIRLRGSPLCLRPKDLLPMEEWMGQAIEEKSKRSQVSARALREGANFSSGLTSTKSSNLDFTRHSRQTSAGEFGAKPLFPPGSREGDKTSDSSMRIGFGPLSPRTEHLNGSGRPGFGERDHANARDRVSARFGNLRSSRDEGESWIIGKQTKKGDPEDGERAFHRRGDRDHNTNGIRENGREHHRRYGSDAMNEGIRSKDWRSGDKNSGRHSRDWNNAQEQDPEWMVEEKAEQESRKYTADDFEAWKKSMKAQQAAAKGDSAPEVSLEPKVASIPVAAPKKAVETPLLVDSAEDKFFELWAPSEPMPKSTNESRVLNTNPVVSKANKPSKFTGFFASETPTVPAQSTMSPDQVSDASNKPPATEDQQGIQRILEMLKNKPSANPTTAAALLKSPKHRTPPPPEAISTSATPPLVSPRPKPHGVQNFLNPQSPAPDANSQFLLNLMRSKDTEPPQQSHYTVQTHGTGGPSNQSSLPQHDRTPNGNMSANMPPIFDKLNPSAPIGQQRRHGRNDSRSFDEGSISFPHQQHVPPPGFPPGFSPAQNAPSFPPGLGPTPNGQSGSFTGQRGPVGMPPGFGQPGPFRNGLNYPPGFGLPHQMGGMNLGDQGPGPGPGLGVPPGFAGPGGYGRPPPGFGDRNGPAGMLMENYGDDRQDNHVMYGPRD